MNKYIYTILLVFLCLVLNAQDVIFKKSNFKDDKEGFKSALSMIEKGDELLEKGREKVLSMKYAGDEYNESLQYYLEAYAFNSNSSELNRKIGHAYLYTNEPYKAKSFLVKSLELNNNPDPFLYFLLGKSYQLEKDFEAAEKNYLKFGKEAHVKTLDVYKKLNRKHIQECKSGAEIFSVKRRYWVDNVKELNTKVDEVAPCITADGSAIIFSSNRTGNMDIYIAEKERRKWKDIDAITELNTEQDDVASSLSYDGQRILLFKNIEGQNDIFETKLDGTTWLEPKLKMSKVVNTNFNETFASYDPQDIKVYYVTDGGHGGDLDIIFSGKKDQEERYWGKGQSAGHEINSAFHEGSVYMAPDGQTMYFCSQGHTSIGGYDVFVSYRDERGLWGKPINMGYPINTPYDELYFSISANGKYAYFASNRAEGSGGMDIYKATFWGSPKKTLVVSEDNLIASIANPIEDTYVPEIVAVEKKSSLTVFKGRILDGIMQTPISAEINIFDNSTGEIYAIMHSNSATGKFLLSLPSGLNYGISVEAEGYLFHSENFNLPKGSVYNMINKDIFLKNIDIGSKIALRNVFFSTGKAEVKIDSYPELDRLIELMNSVPTLKIELSGHTDNVGNDDFNQNLSQRRADAVRAYLVTRGVDKKRVTAVGYGETRPVDTNETNEGKANNRRTEFEITDN